MSFRPTLAVALLVPGLVAAAELGRLTVLSGVGEPLRAEIEIVAVRPGEAAALRARIPPADVFWRANLEPAPVMDALSVGVERRPQGRYVIALRSSGPIADPFIQLLVELTSPAGSIVREYPFLLEEPRGRRPRAVTAPPSALPGAPIEEVSPPVVAPSDGYVVKAGDTLAVVAESLRPPGVTLEQMIVALYQANERAFVDGNMNRLRASETLAVPGEDAARRIDAAMARSIILEHRTGFDGYRGRLAGAAAIAPARSGAPAPATTSAHAAGDQLRLSRADERKSGGPPTTTAREDDLAALHHSIDETKERIVALERNIDDLRRLLAVKKERITSLEKDVKPLVLKDHEFARMLHEGPTAVETREPPLDGADAPRAGDGKWALERFLREHGWLLLVAFLLGFLSWIVMPFKTLRLWVRKHRRRVRRAGRATERVRRAARHAGLLPSLA